jgi:hypothetical protein
MFKIKKNIDSVTAAFCIAAGAGIFNTYTAATSQDPLVSFAYGVFGTAFSLISFGSLVGIRECFALSIGEDRYEEYSYYGTAQLGLFTSIGVSILLITANLLTDTEIKQLSSEQYKTPAAISSNKPNLPRFG